MNAAVKQQDLAKASRNCVSPRGPFEIFDNTKIEQPAPPAGPADPAEVAKAFEHGALAEEYGEEPVRLKLAEMMDAYQGGAAVTSLFSQKAPDGMSLVHAWFGPNFPLFAHSHPRYGDCLYYVVAGEVILGKHRLGPGAGFFVPNGHPYRYTAGPAGVEVLEFRAGGGEPGAARLRLEEPSLDAIQTVIDRANEHRDSWRCPENIGDTAFRQAEPSPPGPA